MQTVKKQKTNRKNMIWFIFYDNIMVKTKHYHIYGNREMDHFSFDFLINTSPKKQNYRKKNLIL